MRAGPAAAGRRHSMKTLWYPAADAAGAADAAAEWLAARLRALGREGGTIVLAGGQTPVTLYDRLARQEAIPWDRFVLIPGDERCLPEGDPQRNDVMIAEALLARLPIRPAGFIPIPAQQGPASAAAAFDAIVREKLPPLRVAILGVGEDGHTASLFPGDAALTAPGLVAPVWRAPKTPPERVTLTLAALNRAEYVVFLVTGTAKADALRRWKAGEALPAARVRSRRAVAVFFDAAAAGQTGAGQP